MSIESSRVADLLEKLAKSQSFEIETARELKELVEESARLDTTAAAVGILDYLTRLYKAEQTQLTILQSLEAEKEGQLH